MRKFRPVRPVVLVALAALAMVACESKEHQDVDQRLAVMDQAIAELRTQIQTNQKEILKEFRKLKGNQQTMIEHGMVIARDAMKKGLGAGDQTDIKIGDAPSLGKADAPVEVVEFADFQCPYCIRRAGFLEGLVKANPDQIRVGFRHYPIGRHRFAVAAGRAAWAAQQQGKFWEMHDALFSSRGKIDDDVIRKHAEAIGLDMEKFERDWQSRASEGAVFKDRRAGKKAGVQGTPTFYVNGVLVGGNVGSVEKTVRRALAAKEGAADKPPS